MRFKHRDQRFNENWNEQKNANRDMANQRQIERESHHIAATTRGQDLAHKQHGAEMGLKWDQHGTQKHQWGQEFGEKKRQFDGELGMRGNELLSLDAWRQGSLSEDKRQFNVSRQDSREDVQWERDQAQADTLLSAMAGAFGGGSREAQGRVGEAMSDPERRKEMAGLLDQAMKTIDKGTSAQDTIQTIAPLIASMRGLTGLGMPGEDVDPLDTFKETENLFEAMIASGGVNANQANQVLDVARKKAMDEHKDWRGRQMGGMAEASGQDVTWQDEGGRRTDQASAWASAQQRQPGPGQAPAASDRPVPADDPRRAASRRRREASAAAKAERARERAAGRPETPPINRFLDWALGS